MAARAAAAAKKGKGVLTAPGAFEDTPAPVEAAPVVEALVPDCVPEVVGAVVFDAAAAVAPANSELRALVACG